jgi:hypothetical protein
MSPADSTNAERETSTRSIAGTVLGEESQRTKEGQP